MCPIWAEATDIAQKQFRRGAERWRRRLAAENSWESEFWKSLIWFESHHKVMCQWVFGIRGEAGILGFGVASELRDFSISDSTSATGRAKLARVNA